jgi:hypothetical protein
VLVRRCFLGAIVLLELSRSLNEAADGHRVPRASLAGVMPGLDQALAHLAEGKAGGAMSGRQMDRLSLVPVGDQVDPILSKVEPVGGRASGSLTSRALGSQGSPRPVADKGRLKF